MNATKLSLVALVAMSGFGMAGSAVAQRVVTNAYAVDPSGVIVKNPFGQCWRTYSWTPQTAIRECDPSLFPAPVAAAPAPAPRPAVTPPPEPAPVIARVVDSDGDGVPDGADRCPGTPSGAHVNAAGCELDADADGVFDRLDKCPGTAAGTRVDSAGCEIADVIILKGVNFASDSARLTPDSLPVLDDAAQTLMKRGNVSTEIAGYTDDRGSEEHNHVLSQRRADAVKDYLVSKGVPVTKISSRGYGEDSPIADNKTASGRAANRRVELRAQ